MLSMKDKKRFLMMAISCLRNESENDPILKSMNAGKPVPTKEEVASIKEGLVSGNVPDDILKKFFRMAYEGVSNQGLLGHFFSGHNRYLQEMQSNEKMKEKAEWCKAYPCKVIEKKGSDFVIEKPDGKRLKTSVFSYEGIELVDQSKVVSGSYVALHRGKIHMMLDKDEFEKASEYFRGVMI